MNKYIRLVILSFMLLGFSGAVSAQGQGLYLGLGGYGVSASDAPYDDTEVDFTASLGYMFNPNFGIELDYYRLGEFDSGNTSLDTYAGALAVMLVAPLKAVKLYAKLGAARVTSRIKTNGTTTFDTDSTEAYGGVGIEFGPKNIGFYLEAMYFPNDVNDITTYGGGIRIWFTK